MENAIVDAPNQAFAFVCLCHYRSCVRARYCLSLFNFLRSLAQLSHRKYGRETEAALSTRVAHSSVRVGDGRARIQKGHRRRWVASSRSFQETLSKGRFSPSADTLHRGWPRPRPGQQFQTRERSFLRPYVPSLDSLTRSRLSWRTNGDDLFLNSRFRQGHSLQVCPSP